MTAAEVERGKPLSYMPKWRKVLREEDPRGASGSPGPAQAVCVPIPLV